jgi:hypothetical protein
MAEHVVSDTYKHLLQPDTLLPSQYFAALKRKSHQEPERRLAIAVLEDAVDCYQKHLLARDRKCRQLFDDADQWIASEDRSWPFAFENICDLLHINSEYLRRGLETWRERQLAQRGVKVVHLNRELPNPAEDDAPLRQAN